MNKLKISGRLILAVLCLYANYEVNAQCGFQATCPTTDYLNFGMGSNANAASVEYDNFISSYHSTVVRTANGSYKTWGESVANNGTTNLLSPTEITVANFPALTGNVLKAHLGSLGSGTAQGIVLTTTGLFAWGIEGTVLHANITSSTTFQKLTINGQTDGLPPGVDPLDVKMIFTTYNTLALLTCSGNVWVIAQDGEVTGTGVNTLTAAQAVQWYQVTQSTTGFPLLSNVIQVRGNESTLFALKSDGTIWTWGAETYLGDATVQAIRNRATQMVLPSASPIKMIGVTRNDANSAVSYYVLNADGNLYSLGYNGQRQLGDWSTTNRTTWVQPRYTSAAGPVMNNIHWISPNEHDARYGAINVLTSDSTNYNWGDANGEMIGRGGPGTFNPGMPNGINITDRILAVETGGHTSMLVKKCEDYFGYVGHRINGSMGDGTNNTTNESTYTFATAVVFICGATNLDVTITGSPTFGAGGLYCNGSSVDLIPSPTGGALTLLSGPGSLSGTIMTFNGTGNTTINVQYAVTVPGCPIAKTTTLALLTEDCTPIGVTLSGTTSIAENAAGVATLTATLSAPASTATTVTLTYTGTASGADYAASSVTITIPAGSTTGTVTIDPTDDLIFEGSETVIANITNVTGGDGATETGTQTATVTITDNETAPTVTLSGTTSIAENAAGTATLTATLSATAPTATTVTLTYSGTASGPDYTASSVTITIPAGSTAGTVTIDPTDDAIFEGSETVIADITSVTGGNGATESGTQTATVTITDDETTPTVTLSGTTSIVENAAGVATLTATLSVATTTATTVTLTYTGTASGSDYTASSVTITIPAGSTTGTVTIDPTDDLIFEGSETVIADITGVTGGNGATESGTQTATVTITDDETTPTVTLSGTTSIAENAAGVATLTATLSVATTTATTVTLTYTGTASGSDYTASSVTITIPAGSTTGTVTIDPTDDAIFEGSETVIADITSVTGGNGATESGTQTATVTITDDETTPTVTLSGTTSIAENAAGVATLTATLSVATTTATTVTLTYTGTASGSDYTASSVTITIPAGSTTGTVTIDPTDDLIFEGSETVIADITGVTGGNGATESGTQTATVTITDDETTPTVTLSGTTSIAENAAGVATLTATLSVATTTATTVTLTYTGTASGSDYTASSVTITIPAGSTTGTVNIDPTDDAIFEGSETVIADITNVTGGNGATESGTQTATVTIVDVNNPPVANNNSTTTNEDQNATITAIQTNDTDTDGSVVSNTIDLDPTTIGQQTVFVSTNGSWSVNLTTGNVTFVPNANFNGIESITYTINDNSGAISNQANLTVTVNPINDGPVVDNETHVINEDTPATGDLTNVGDSDVDGNLVVNTTPLSGPANGTITINANGTYTYTPNANYNGNDQVVVQICDDGTPLPAICINDTIFITVNPINDGPIVDNETHVINEDTPATGDLTNAGDSDVDGNLVVNTTPLSGPANGTITINANGTYTYTPNANFNGNDQVVVQICDDGTPLPAICVNDTIFITVNPINDGPIVDNETHVINEDTPATGDLTNAGDSDVDGNLVVNTTPLSGPANGTITINANGTYTYTPNANYNGNDQVVVQICDDGTPLPAICINDTIFITVNPINDGPIVDNETHVINEDTPATGDLTNAGDSDVDGNLVVNTTPLSGPANGTITINPDGTYTYTPNANFNGNDQVVVQICDDGTPLPAICVNDTIFIMVNPINDGPVVDNETHVTPQEIPVTGDLTNSGDSDLDGNLVVNTTPLSGPSNGTIIINPDGTYTYTPNAGYSGPDTVIVQICDDGTPLPAICVNDTIFITVDGCLTNPNLDCDGDGVTNADEIADGTDPSDPCSVDLTSVSVTPAAAWGDLDCDNDGLTNGEEETEGTDPFNPDTDGDGVTDGTEVADGTEPLDPCDLLIASINVTPSAAWADLDCDNDGLTNGEEETAGTDPFNPDTDGDGVTDGTEVADGTEPLDPCDLLIASINVTPSAAWADLDCDNDGLTNGEEETEGTDPFNPDTDGDGVTDGTEVADGTEPLDPCDLLIASINVTPSAAWADLDCDNDGLTNGEEETEGTDPFNPDTDGDGVTDGTEVVDGTEPLDPCDLLIASINVTPSAAWADLDCDNDGLTNGEEETEGTDPFNPDTDGDGVTDGTEVADGTNPLNPCDYLTSSVTLTPSDTWSDLDCDGDGLTNGEELEGGSNPLDACDPNTCGIVIPEAFTPDGDGTNDEFVILGIENYPDNEFIIFNRWGNLVYTTTGYQNDWKGTSNQGIVIGGEELPTGTYYYTLDLKVDGKEPLKGFIYLQR